jgi:prefoldin beta subunit
MGNDEDVQEKMQRLSMMQHTLTTYQNQKQGYQQSLLESESALQEIDASPEIYRIIGNVIVKKTSADVKKELEEKCETLQLRIQSIEKQEKQLEEKAKALQDEVVKHMESQK